MNLDDLNHLLLFVVPISCAMTLVRTARGATRQAGWVGVFSLVLAVTGAAFLVRPGIAGLLGGLVWGVLVILPGVANRLVGWAAARRRFAAALGFARLAWLLHPLDGWDHQVDQLRQLAESRRLGLDDLFYPPIARRARLTPREFLRRGPVVTYVLILLNVAFFAREWAAGGSTNEAALKRLGALAPSLVLRGQWWRLVTANFLHFGLLHVAVNLYALWLLGPFVEKTLGAARYAAVYLFSGIGALAGIVLFVKLRWLKDDDLVGASAAIMGLVGATGAIYLRRWRRDRSPATLRQLGGVATVVVLQIVFDQLTPQVSGSAHAAGVLLGFLSSLVVGTRPAQPKLAAAVATL